MDEEMKREFDALKAVIGGLKTDVSELKTDVRVLKTDVGEIRGVQRRMAGQVAKLSADMVDFRHELKADIAAFADSMNRRFDGMMALFEDTRYRHAVHADTLLQHDLRLKKLESRGS